MKLKKSYYLIFAILIIIVFIIYFNLNRDPMQSLDDATLYGSKGRMDLNRDNSGYNGIAVSGHPLASEIGINILKSGGNAIDAAVAISFAICLLEPHASGLGGGGFIILHSAKTDEEIVIDFRETAPAASTYEFYERFLKNDGKDLTDEFATSGEGVAIPGEVAGLLTALEKYGTMTRAQAIQPSLDLEKSGITVTASFANLLKKHKYRLEQFQSSRDTWFNDQGNLYQKGDKWHNPGFAKTLMLIAKKGMEGFYTGELANAIVHATNNSGGILSLEDLSGYSVKIRKPIRGNYRGYDILAAPPSASGATVIELLQILDNFDMAEYEFQSAERWHLWTESMKLAYADKKAFLGDTDFTDVPLDKLCSSNYANDRAKLIKADEVITVASAGSFERDSDGNTTAIVVSDKEGNMIAITKSLNWYFGSAVTVPDYGFVLNNHMRSFSYEKQSPNLMSASKRPISSMSPVLVFHNDNPYMAISSPGASKIIAAVSQVISNVIDYDFDIKTAVNLPRAVNYNGGKLYIERRIPESIQDDLTGLGHKVSISSKEFNSSYGGVQAIVIDKNGLMHGASDPRRGGQAIAY
jgi:gamma-glutamyltranspeptidase / glutathione hydrolase